MNKLPLIRIEYRNADGNFFTSAYFRFEKLVDVQHEVNIFLNRFPNHTASFSFAIED